MPSEDLPDDASACRTLKRLAAALGRPVQDFYQSDDADPNSTGRTELLMLWDTLETEASRQAVLKLVWAIVEAEGG